MEEFLSNHWKNLHMKKNMIWIKYSFFFEKIFQQILKSRMYHHNDRDLCLRINYSTKLNHIIWRYRCLWLSVIDVKDDSIRSHLSYFYLYHIAMSWISSLSLSSVNSTVIATNKSWANWFWYWYWFVWVSHERISDLLWSIVKSTMMILWIIKLKHKEDRS